MAGGLHELYTKVLARDFPQLPVGDARITLVEMADRLLAPFTPKSSERARRALARRGVDVRFGVSVDRVERGAGPPVATATQLRAGTIVWATGVKAEGLAATLGTPIDARRAAGGRARPVDPRPPRGLRDRRHRRRARTATGRRCRRSPSRRSRAASTSPARSCGASHGEPTEPFRYHDKGQMATIGRHDAVAELANGWRFSGPIGWLAWLGLHLVYLMGFRNRIKVFVDWAWNYLTYDRGNRILREADRQIVERELE